MLCGSHNAWQPQNIAVYDFKYNKNTSLKMRILENILFECFKEKILFFKLVYIIYY